MTKNFSQKVALSILTETGILENRSVIVDELESDLYLTYAEFDGEDPLLFRGNRPVQYINEVSTQLDLISNGQIYKSLYKLINPQQRTLIHKITNNNDYYVFVGRGKALNFIQKWEFSFIFKKDKYELSENEILKFQFIVGVRDTYPFDIKIKKELRESNAEKILIRLNK